MLKIELLNKQCLQNNDSPNSLKTKYNQCNQCKNIHQFYDKLKKDSFLAVSDHNLIGIRVINKGVKQEFNKCKAVQNLVKRIVSTRYIQKINTQTTSSREFWTK